MLLQRIRPLCYILHTRKVKKTVSFNQTIAWLKRYVLFNILFVFDLICFADMISLAFLRDFVYPILTRAKQLYHKRRTVVLPISIQTLPYLSTADRVIHSTGIVRFPRVFPSREPARKDWLSFTTWAESHCHHVSDIVISKNQQRTCKKGLIVFHNLSRIPLSPCVLKCHLMSDQPWYDPMWLTGLKALTNYFFFVCVCMTLWSKTSLLCVDGSLLCCC